MQVFKFKKWLYKSLTGPGIEILYIIILLGIFLFMDQFIFKKGFELSDYFEIKLVTSLSATYFISFFIKGMVKQIERDIEDGSKLSNDAQSLIRIYKEDQNDMIKYIGLCDREYLFPLKILFENNKKHELIIKDSKESFYRLPSLIENNYTELFSAHKSSKVFNALMIRLDDLVINESEIVMKTSRTNYYNLLVSNRAMDKEFGSKLTVRDLYEFGPRISNLKKSELSNHLGFNIIFETLENEIVLVKRNKKVSIGKGVYSLSVSSALKTDKALDRNTKEFSISGLYRSIRKEVFCEIGLNREDYDFVLERDLKLIYQDLVEGGKPQLLFYVKTELKSEDFIKKLQQRVKEDKKVKKKMLIDGEELIFLKKEVIRLEPNYLIINKGSNIEKKHYIQTQTAGCLAFCLNDIT